MKRSGSVAKAGYVDLMRICRAASGQVSERVGGEETSWYGQGRTHLGLALAAVALLHLGQHIIRVPPAADAADDVAEPKAEED